MLHVTSSIVSELVNSFLDRVTAISDREGTRDLEDAIPYLQQDFPNLSVLVEDVGAEEEQQQQEDDAANEAEEEVDRSELDLQTFLAERGTTSYTYYCG